MEQKPKSPSEMGKSLVETVGLPLKRDTRKLPGRVKLAGYGMEDVTDQVLGKSLIITGGSFSSKPNAEEKKEPPKERAMDEKPKSPSVRGRRLVVPPEKKPKSSTPVLPASTKPLTPRMRDITAQRIGKSFIILGGGFSKPDKPEESKDKK